MLNEGRDYYILGRPRPLQRVRFSNGRAYDPQAKEKEAARQQLLFQHGIKEPKWSGAIHMAVEFFMPLCGTKAQKEKNSGAWHYKRPDTSNLIKFVEDAAIGALFEDDCIIASIIARKTYCKVDQSPGTVLSIFPLGKHEEGNGD